MPVSIRSATAQDAESIGVLVSEFQAYLHALGDTTPAGFGAAAYLRDGFGDDPAFTGLVAESDADIVGYLLYHFGYDTDRGERLLHVIDLFVQQAWRGQGVGEALMHRAATIGRSRGAKAMVWCVYAPNVPALRFYERLGADYLRDLEWMTLRLD